MAVKPIIDIEVNDAEFRRFYDLFEAYSAELDQMPEAWRELGAAMGESTKGFETGSLSAKGHLAIAAAQAGIIAEALRDAGKAANDLDKSAGKGAKSMDKLRKGAEGVGKAIELVGGWVVKLAAIGGLGAIFSGFGFGELASAAFQRYRAASSVGVSPGLYSSFQVNAQQFLPTSALEAAANAQNDISKAGYLAALGITNATAMNPADLAFEELKRARTAYLQNPALAMQNPAIQSYLALGGSIGDVRNAANVPLSQLLAAQNRTHRDSGMLGFSAQTAQAWSNLKITLDKAGVAIETDLINKLGPLAPKLEELATGVINAVAAFLGGKNFDKVIDEAKGGIESLAQFVEHTDWKTFGKNVSEVASDMGTAALALDAFMKSPFIKFFLRAAGDIPGQIHNLPKTDPILNGSIWRWIQGAGKNIASLFTHPFESGAPATLGAILGTAKHLGVDPVLALADAMKESGLNPRAVGDKGTSFGIFQLHRGGELPAGMTAEQAFDPGTNAAIALREFAAVAKSHPGWSPGAIALLAQRPAEFHAGMTRAQAEATSYARDVNANYTRIAREMRSYIGKNPGPKGEQHHAPKQATVNRSRQRQRPPVHVAVTNTTSARVAVSLNAVAAS